MSLLYQLMVCLLDGKRLPQWSSLELEGVLWLILPGLLIRSARMLGTLI